jgi:hypothetical protein
VNLAVSKSPERQPGTAEAPCVVCHWIAQRNPVLFEFDVTSYSSGDYAQFRITNAAGVEQVVINRYPKVTGATGTLSIDLSPYLLQLLSSQMQTVFNPWGGSGGATGRTTPYDYPDGTRQFPFYLEYRINGTGAYTRVTGTLGTELYTAIWAAKQLLDPYGQNMLRYYPFRGSDGSNLIANGDFTNELERWFVTDSTVPPVSVSTLSGLSLVFSSEGATEGLYSIRQNVTSTCDDPELCVTFIEGTSVEITVEYTGPLGSYTETYSGAVDGTFCETLTGVGTGAGTLEITVIPLSAPANITITDISLVCEPCAWLADFLTEFETPVIWKRLDGGTGVQEFAFPFISSRDMELTSNFKYEWINSLGVVTNTQNVTHDTGGDNVLNMDFDNQAVLTNKYVRVSVQDSLGVEYFNPVTLEIRDCVKNGVYLRWVNKLGGDAYWMFTLNQERQETTNNELTITRNIDYLESSNNPLNLLRKSATESMTLAEESVTLEQEKGLRGLRHSTKVEMYLPDVNEWVEVLVQDGSFALKPTKSTRGRFVCTITLPEIYIQRR